MPSCESVLVLLQAWCSMVHRPGGSSRNDQDLRETGQGDLQEDHQTLGRSDDQDGYGSRRAAKRAEGWRSLKTGKPHCRENSHKGEKGGVRSDYESPTPKPFLIF